MIAAGLQLVRRLGQINWGLADQVVVSGGNFLTTLFLARSLGVEEFGRFTLAWMVVLFAGHLQQALILAPMMSIGPKQERAAAPAYFGSLMVQQAMLVPTSSAAILLGILLLDQLSVDALLLPLLIPLLAANAAHQVQEFLRRYFFTTGQSAAALVGDVIRYLGQAAAMALLVTVPGFDSASALWLAAATALAASGAGIRCLGHLSWDAAVFRHVAARQWQTSRWLVGAYAAGWIGGNSLQLVAAAMLGSAAVGVVRAVETLLGPMQVVYLGLCGVTPVEASRAFAARGAPGLTAYLRRLAWLSCAISVPVALLLSLWPAFWLDLLFGADYAASATVAAWLAAKQVVVFLLLPLTVGLLTLERSQGIWQGTFWPALGSLVLAYPLIAAFGIHGIAIGLLISAALRVLIHYLALRNSLRLHQRCDG
jgi:O-antigen/teichoic acid export membrane protein